MIIALIALILLVAAVMVWRLELARMYRGRPEPRHARAAGLPFHHQPKEPKGNAEEKRSDVR